MYTTVGVEADHGTRGTGFLIADTPSTTGEVGHVELSWERPQTKAYLVTAAHGFGNCGYLQATRECTLTYNGPRSEGFSARSKTFTFSQDPPNWALHEDAAVDVLALQRG